MEVIAGDIQKEEPEAREQSRHIGKQRELVKSWVRRQLQTLCRKDVRV
jgi:hypothetical protein